MSMKVRTLAVTVLCSALVACGSTVPLTQQTALDPGQGFRATDAGRTPAAAAQPTAGTPSGPGGDVAGPEPSSRVAAQSPGGVAPSAVQETLSPVEVGILTQGSSGEAGKALGFNAADNGDEPAYAKIVIDDLNRRGGVAGHRIIPVVYNISSSQSQNVDDVLQAACAFFTQDHKVVAALLSWHGHSSSFYSCLEKHGVLIIDTNGIVTDDASALRQLPHLIAPNGIGLDRVAGLLPSAAGRSWFGGEPVGVIAVDAPAYHRAVEQHLKPALSAVGARFASVVYTTPYKTASDAASISTQLSNAVVRFRSQGITRVVDLSGAVLVFATVAEAQQYRPRYALTSTSSPAALTANGVPAVQLRGSVGLGWLPVYDSSEVPSAELPRGQAACLQLLRAHGEQPTATTVLYTALTFCEAGGFLHALGAEAPAQQHLTGDSLLASLGTGLSYPSAMTFRSEVTPPRRDGASAYRTFGFAEACSCYRYTGRVTSGR